jgi:hypothetical protein
MLSSWLKDRVALRAVRSGRQELERFVASLRAQSESEIALILAVAAGIRVRLREAGHLPDEVLRVAPAQDYEQATVQRRIARLVQGFQSKSEYIDAAGAMVWLHTLRALTLPELRDPGRQMWEQLARGMQYAPQALAKIEAATHHTSPPGTLLACTFIPEDLTSVPNSKHRAH